MSIGGRGPPSNVLSRTPHSDRAPLIGRSAGSRRYSPRSLLRAERCEPSPPQQASTARMTPGLHTVTLGVPCRGFRYRVSAYIRFTPPCRCLRKRWLVARGNQTSGKPHAVVGDAARCPRVGITLQRGVSNHARAPSSVERQRMPLTWRDEPGLRDGRVSTQVLVRATPAPQTGSAARRGMSEDRESTSLFDLSAAPAARATLRGPHPGATISPSGRVLQREVSCPLTTGASCHPVGAKMVGRRACSERGPINTSVPSGEATRRIFAASARVVFFP